MGNEKDAQGRTWPRRNVPRTGTGRAGTGGREPNRSEIVQRDGKGGIIQSLTNKLWGGKK